MTPELVRVLERVRQDRAAHARTGTAGLAPVPAVARPGTGVPAAGSRAFDTVSVVIRGLMLQARTPEALLGRVSAVNQIFTGSSNEIGAFESGLTARWWGAVTSVVVGGCATLAVVATVAWRVPTLRALRQVKTERAHD